MRNQILGNRYRIIDRIGEGGMAYVYVALDEKLGRKVAIKVLHEHMEKNPDIRKRFQMEAQAVSALEHPNIVKVYDFSGSNSERLWIVTEVIRGKNLAQYAQSTGPGWVNPVLSACIVREICKALDKAHQEGIVHRDIKPENIMLTNEGRVKLMDFGIAKDLGKSSMTVEGTFMGSPSYMSPEQIRGRNVDLRSDLYSLSVLFYEIVTGRLPFTGPTTHDVVLRIIEGEYTHPRYLMPTLPISINEMIVKGMSKSPESRFQSAREFGRELDLFLSGLNFDESHIELERYFKDPQAYGVRLEKSGIATHATRPTARMTRNPQLSIPRSGPLTGRTNAPRPTLKIDQRRTAHHSSHSIRRTPAPIPVPQAPTVRPQQPPARPAPTSYISANGREADALPPPPPPQALPKPMPAAVDQPLLYREPSIEPSVPLYGIAQAPVRRAPLRHIRRDANYMARRNLRYTQVNQSWPLAMLGALLVGIVVMITTWGFWGLQERLNSIARKSQEAPTKQAHLSPSRSNKSHKTKKRRDGTPVIVKHVTKNTIKELEPPAPNKPPKITTGGKKPKKPVSPKKPTYKDDLPIGEVAEVAKAKKKKPTTANVVPVAMQPLSETETEPTPKPIEAVDPTTPSSNESPEKLLEPSPVNKKEKEKAKEKTKDKDYGIQDETSPSPKEAPKPIAKAKIAVSSQPAAEWFLDGKRIGTTVDATAHSGFLTIEPGKHSVELKRQGYRTYKTQIELAPGEHKILPQVVLEPDSESASSKTSPLTLRVDHTPASVVIRNADTDSTQAFVMKSNTRTLQLENGRYQISIEYEGEVKERELVLNGKQMTFSADFKEKSNTTPVQEETQNDE